MILLNGDDLLSSASRSLGIDLSQLIARTSLWAKPDRFQRVAQLNQHGSWFPNMRRYRAGEKVGQIIEGVRLDNNSYANSAAKLAILGSRKAIGFSVCHIWPKTCYDERYHTSVANLILVPSAISGLTDHDDRVCAAIQYRSFELYGWHPVEEPTPIKPEGYPVEWLDFATSQDDVLKRLAGLERRTESRIQTR